ncbi:MAG: dihydroorotate dehydrogenase electron transfer subunit [Sedimentisphaerales bacterium]|nr:dihydroorotate dehydrogenase electron transfer subunit [Sedimentisphaerales bacterium]
MNKESQKKSGRTRGQFVARVAAQLQRGEHHRALVLSFCGESAEVMACAEPGQFVQVACRDISRPRMSVPQLRRPISISGVSEDPIALGLGNGHCRDGCGREVMVRIIYRVHGPGTNWLAHQAVGEEIDIIGPLGRGFNLPKDKDTRVILIGGGVGLPPMFFSADRLKRNGCSDVLGIAGAATRGLFCCDLLNEADGIEDALVPGKYVREFGPSNTPVLLAADDGSIGFKGNVVQALDGYLKRNEQWRSAEVFACGPKPMLRAVANFCQEHSMNCQVCLESYMGCGIGVCQSCAVAMRSEGKDRESPKKYRLVCAHGPVFDAAKVDWDA